MAVGQTLVLEAEFEKDQDDKIDMVTWECDRGSENVRISQNDRISLEKSDALLRIHHVRSDDFGTYKVTVTDSNGLQDLASIEVKKIGKNVETLHTVFKCYCLTLLAAVLHLFFTCVALIKLLGHHAEVITGLTGHVSFFYFRRASESVYRKGFGMFC